MEERHPFYNLAASTWPMLAREGLSDTSLLESVKWLFHSSKTPYFRSWVQSLLEHVVNDLTYHELDPDTLDEIDACIFDDTIRPLHIASALNMPEICEFLIEEGAEIDARCRLGTPLLLAGISFLGLIGRTDDLCEFTSCFFTNYLPIASRRNKAIDYLIHAGADIIISTGHEGCLSMFSGIAVIDCNLKCFAPTIKLISQGVVPTQHEIDDLNEYVEHTFKSDDASELELPLLEFIRYLKKSSAYDTDWGLELGKILWSQALRMGFSFTHDATITDSRIALSDTALLQKTFTAIYNDDADLLQLCLQDGRVNVTQLWTDSINEYTGTLLHHAIREDSPHCTNLLLKLGSDINSRDETGDAPVHVCHLGGDGAVLKVFCEHNIELHTQDSYGYNLWHYCAEDDDWNVKFLDILFHIRPEATQIAVLTKANNGYTPLTLALRNINSDEGLQEECEGKALYYFNYCNGLNHFWNKHESIMADVFASGSIAILERVLSVGCMPSVLENENTTPLHELRADASIDWVDLLKSLFPNAHRCRLKDRLPLELYLEATQSRGLNPDSKIVEALIFDSVFVTTDENQETPWEFMCKLINQHENWETVPKSSLNDGEEGNTILSTLLSLKAMDGYEIKNRECGLNPLFSTLISTLKWTPEVTMYVSGRTLDKAIQISNYWNPGTDLAARFFKKAVTQGNDEIVKILLQHGLNVHQRVDGVTPIEEACDTLLLDQLYPRGQVILKCLLDHSNHAGLREFPPDINGLSILHRIARPLTRSNVNPKWLLNLLVEKGADLNAINPKANTDWRITPLVWHILQRSYSCAEHLLDLGADPNLPDEGVASDAAWASVFEDSIHFLNVLLKHSKERAVMINWCRKINRRVQNVEELLVLEQVTNLHSACLTGNLGCVQFFIENNLIRIDEFSIGGISALHCAALSNASNAPGVIEYLVSKSASTEHADSRGFTALHFAAKWGHLEAVKTLVRMGALNTPTKHATTPRMVAFAAGRGDVVRFLDELFEGPGVGSCKTSVSTQESKVLLQRLQAAIVENRLSECIALLANGCQLNSTLPDCHGCSPLLYAMRFRDRAEIIRWMLQNGASVQMPPCSAHTKVLCHAVEIAARNPSLVPTLPIILRQYLAEGGDFLAGGEAPLHAAVAWNRGNYVGLKLVLEFLLDNASEIG
jgi:ankyrin repeat protein